MKAVIQRVLKANVHINDLEFSSIKKGLLIFLGIGKEDTDEDIIWLSNKILNMRIFGDENDAMNLSIFDINGEILLVSQFTLFASTKKGNRPGFTEAERPELAIPKYEQFIETIKNKLGDKIKVGKFGADMKIELINDGPVTIIIDSKKKE